MERLCGWIEKGYRFEVRVPTEIRDNLAVEITAYRGRRYVADRIYSPLKSMPHWNIPLQAILLSTRDERILNRTIKRFIRKLPEKNDILGNECNNRKIFG